MLEPTDDLPARVLQVRNVVSPVRFFDERMLEVLRWISGRYVAPLAAVIARSHPPRVASEEADLEAGGGRSARLRAPAPAEAAGHPDHLSADAPGLRLASYRGGSELLGAVASGEGTFVLRPAPEEEVDVAVELVGATLAGGRTALVLVPEAAPLPRTASAIVQRLGERAGLFLGGDRRLRYRTWLAIADGLFDVVVGTRPAVFAPLGRLGLVLVCRESHANHREERAPYYHVRDVALARARVEGAICVMSALCPSVEAAALDAAEVAPLGRRWPPVEVVRPGREGRAPRLVAALREARRGFLYEPLPGYGVAQVCRACGEPARCASCGGTLRQEEGSVGCGVCRAAGRCASCGGSTFGIRRGGVERVEEWASRLSSVRVRRAGGSRSVRPGRDEILVGGPETVRDVGPVGLDLVGILDADLAARRPGLSAVERSLAIWMEAAAWAAPSGRVVVQASSPNDPAVQALVSGKPDRFHRFETRRRGEAGFPVGSAVFRVVGSAQLPEELELLEPTSLLTTGDAEQTVCLLALEPGRIEGFGRAMRALAEREIVHRVEAEPHL